MLEKWFVRKLNLEDCRQLIECNKAQKALTGGRLSKLLAKQERNPGWAAYDSRVDEVVGIGIRIEEQYAVAGELEENLLLLEDRVRVIILAAAVTGKTPAPGRRPIQLGFFDSSKRREQMGVTVPLMT